MKNFKTLCASAILVLYALLAGASIDDNGDFEGWFIALCIIVPIAVFIIGMILHSAEKEQKRKALSKIPKTYSLDKEGVGCAFYTDSHNKRILAVSYDTSTHNTIEINGVEKGNSFSYMEHYFLIDDKNQQVLFVNAKGKNIKRKLIRYNEIIGVDISENGHSVFNKSTSSTVGRAIVGGVLLGGVGAVIGGVTGKSKEKKTIDSYKITIQLIDINNLTYEIEFIDHELELDDLGKKTLAEIKDYVNKIKSALLTIIKSNEMMNQAKVLEQVVNQKHIDTQEVKELPENNGYSIADELLKLSNLHKQGILTDEEFETQKQKVLNPN